MIAAAVTVVFFGGPSAKKKSTSPLWEKQKNVIQFLVYSSTLLLHASLNKLETSWELRANSCVVGVQYVDQVFSRAGSGHIFLARVGSGWAFSALRPQILADFGLTSANFWRFFLLSCDFWGSDWVRLSKIWPRSGRATQNPRPVGQISGWALARPSPRFFEDCNLVKECLFRRKPLVFIYHILPPVLLLLLFFSGLPFLHVIACYCMILHVMECHAKTGSFLHVVAGHYSQTLHDIP